MSRVFLCCVIGAIVSATLVSAGSCQARCANAFSSQAHDAFRSVCVDSDAPNDFVVQVVDSKTLKCNSLKHISCNKTDTINTCRTGVANLQSSYPALGTCVASMEDCVGGSCQVTCASLGQAAINSWRPTCFSQNAYNVYVTSNSIKCTWSEDFCNIPNIAAICNGVASDFNSGGTSTGCTATLTDCAANPTASPTTYTPTTTTMATTRAATTKKPKTHATTKKSKKTTKAPTTKKSKKTTKAPTTKKSKKATTTVRATTSARRI